MVSKDLDTWCRPVTRLSSTLSGVTLWCHCLVSQMKQMCHLGTRLSSTAANAPHSPHVGSEALLIRDTQAGAGTNPRNPLNLVLMWQKRGLRVESCMRPNQPCTGSGMGTQLSTHQAAVKNMLKVTIKTHQYMRNKMREGKNILGFWSSLAHLIPMGNFFFQPLLLLNLNLKLFQDDIKYILKNILFRQCWRTFCNYCDCLKLFWKPPSPWLKMKVWSVVNDKRSLDKKVVLKESCEPSICDYSSPPALLSSMIIDQYFWRRKLSGSYASCKKATKTT